MRKCLVNSLIALLLMPFFIMIVTLADENISELSFPFYRLNNFARQKDDGTSDQTTETTTSAETASSTDSAQTTETTTPSAETTSSTDSVTSTQTYEQITEVRCDLENSNYTYEHGGYQCNVSCINNNTGYYNLSTAWDMCGVVKLCTRIFRWENGSHYNYHLRKEDDIFEDNDRFLYIDYDAAKCIEPSTTTELTTSLTSTLPSTSILAPISTITPTSTITSVTKSNTTEQNETTADETCNAVNLNIQNGFGMAIVKNCLTSDPMKRWAKGCNVTFECLQGYRLKGDKEFTCINGRWTPEEKPTCMDISAANMFGQSKCAKILMGFTNTILITIFSVYTL